MNRRLLQRHWRLNGVNAVYYPTPSSTPSKPLAFHLHDGRVAHPLRLACLRLDSHHTVSIWIPHLCVESDSGCPHMQQGGTRSQWTPSLHSDVRPRVLHGHISLHRWWSRRQQHRQSHHGQQGPQGCPPHLRYLHDHRRCAHGHQLLDLLPLPGEVSSIFQVWPIYLMFQGSC